MHHGQGTPGQAEMVWAYATERRRWLCQTNPRGRRPWTTESRKTEKERDGPTSSSTKWRTCGSRWRTQGIVPNGEGEPVCTLTPHQRDSQPEGERERERESPPRTIGHRYEAGIGPLVVGTSNGEYRSGCHSVHESANAAFNFMDLYSLLVTISTQSFQGVSPARQGWVGRQ